MEGLVYCPRCEQSKKEDDFAANKARPNGKAGYCKVCMRQLVQEWKKANPKRLAAQQRRAAERKRAEVTDPNEQP